MGEVSTLHTRILTHPKRTSLDIIIITVNISITVQIFRLF